MILEEQTNFSILQKRPNKIKLIKHVFNEEKTLKYYVCPKTLTKSNALLLIVTTIMGNIINDENRCLLSLPHY